MRNDDWDEEYRDCYREHDPGAVAAIIGIVLGLLLALVIIAGFGGKLPDGFVESLQRMNGWQLRLRNML